METLDAAKPLVPFYWVPRGMNRSVGSLLGKSKFKVNNTGLYTRDVALVGPHSPGQWKVVYDVIATPLYQLSNRNVVPRVVKLKKMLL